LNFVLALDYGPFEAHALHEVDVALTTADLVSDVHMRVDQSLSSGDIHALDLGHVIGHFFDGHFLFFAIDEVLDVLQLLVGVLAQVWQTHVSHLLENEVLLIRQLHLLQGVCITTLSICLSWVDDTVSDARVA